MNGLQSKLKIWTLGRRKPRHLPLATGPYVPGAMDVMLDYSLHGLFMRIYYPTNYPKSQEENFARWIPWIPDSTYIEGIAYVLMVFKAAIKGLIWWTGNVHVPVQYGEAINEDVAPLKCIILSHGLGGHRFLYTHICYDLASHGFVVFALEHRDSSASNTYYYETREDAEQRKMTQIKFKRINLDKEHFDKRKEQVNMRSDECCRALNFILALNEGEVPENIMNCAENHRDCSFDLSDMVGKLDVDNIVMMGHSFGGASALKTLSLRKELKVGIILDPWMFAIKDERLFEQINQPLLFVNTQTFHIQSNVDVMSKYLMNTKSSMYTLLHTTHESQTDTALMIGYWLNWYMRKLEPEKALKINNALILTFLKQHIRFPKNIEEQEALLKSQAANIAQGLTKAWA